MTVVRLEDANKHNIYIADRGWPLLLVCQHKVKRQCRLCLYWRSQRHSPHAGRPALTTEPNQCILNISLGFVAVCFCERTAKYPSVSVSSVSVLIIDHYFLCIVILCIVSVSVAVAIRGLTCW